MDASGVALVLIGPGSIDQVCPTMGSKCVHTSINTNFSSLLPFIKFLPSAVIQLCWTLFADTYILYRPKPLLSKQNLKEVHCY